MPTCKTLPTAIVVAFAVALRLSPAGAQTPTDPVSATRALFNTGQPATRAAADLKSVHRQTVNEATGTLKTVGYTAVAIATALKIEYATTGNQAYDAMASAGFSAHATGNALAQAGIPVGMDCVDQQNNVVPCGTFGGMTNTPVMGQVTWTPKTKGYIDSTLTISGTNIPAVTIRIGSMNLTTVSASPSKVVVKLPSSAWTGPLSMRRNSDNVEGKMESMYDVVPYVVPVDWTSAATQAVAGAIEDARRWLTGARITPGKCSINGMLATGTVGALSTTTDLAGKVKASLTAAGVPSSVATSWDAAFQDAWHEWSNGITIPSLPWYPTFAMYPAANAPAVPNVPTPLGGLVSTGILSLSPPQLRTRIVTAIGAAGTSSQVQAAVTVFVTAFAARFTIFMATGLVGNVAGNGSVPTYNPPNVTAGPVKGTCTGSAIVTNANVF